MKIKPCLVVPTAVLLLAVWTVPALAQYVSVNSGARYAGSRTVHLDPVR